MKSTVPLQRDQGTCLLPRRAEHRAPGSGRDFDRLDPAGARACGHRRAMTEHELAASPVSPGAGIGPCPRFGRAGRGSGGRRPQGRACGACARRSRARTHGGAAEGPGSRCGSGDPRHEQVDGGGPVARPREVMGLAARLPPADALRVATKGTRPRSRRSTTRCLSARAADVRELGRRAVRALSGGGARRPRHSGLDRSSHASSALRKLIDLRLDEGLVLGLLSPRGRRRRTRRVIATAIARRPAWSPRSARSCSLRSAARR